MAKEKLGEEEAMLRGQADIWEYMLGFVDSMALKCAVELGVADIINSHGHPITLSQIASSMDSPSPDINCLSRIMRLLVRKRIFISSPHPESGDLLYGLTHSSKWLLREAELSLAPMVKIMNHQWLLEPWHCMNECVKEGGIAFEKAHGSGIWDFASANPEFNNLFNEGMAGTSKITIKVILSAYKDGFEGARSLVDVGGGTGIVVNEIVKAHPHIHGICFDLPHVVATAPKYPGVSHISGDMFAAIPAADTIFMKWIMHDWSDENCVKILKNCRKAILEKNGKVIIVDVVLQPDGEGLFDNTGLVFDLVMVALAGGRERTEVEWKKILEEGGFSRYKIIKIPALHSIIEAYPWLMHGWSDEDCVKILKNCHKAIPEKNGKVIIVDVVLQPNGEGLFDNTGLVFDLVMVTHTSGGKERTEVEWKKILEEGGFSRCKIIKIPALQSIIEAYPV
ncbi:hypothetical protein HHK36_023689 [Tetracentron sinense]|uniref:Uncharacterized protein n=1 Tax=Tetracentron sinense TaxID=13715 RepID=A0A834YNN5_TETSI|nr:hypothetical protein HHK36_023689 [Tetracentron sinense]